jgi:hypothetical protein
MVERGGQREDRFAVLDRGHPPGGEGPAVPHPVHDVDERHRGITRPDEVGMQRVHWPVGGNGTAGGDQRLPCHLAPEDPLPPVVGAAAAEDIGLDLLQVEQVDQAIECLAHVAPHRRFPGPTPLPRNRTGPPGGASALGWPEASRRPARRPGRTSSRNRDGFLDRRPPAERASDQDR